MRKGFRSKAGFTLIELLMVISIIGLLSSVILASLTVAREKAKIAKAQSDLIQLRDAVGLMGNDTGVWPKGCLIGKIEDGPDGSGFFGANNEVALNDIQGGLTPTRPAQTGVDLSDSCQWTATAVNSWNGPYYRGSGLDPWGTAYWFDNDFEPYRNCDTANPIQLPTTAVLVSAGPDKQAGATDQAMPFGGSDAQYNCDDIFIKLP